MKEYKLIQKVLEDSKKEDPRKTMMEFANTFSLNYQRLRRFFQGKIALTTNDLDILNALVDVWVKQNSKVTATEVLQYNFGKKLSKLEEQGVSSDFIKKSVGLSDWSLKNIVEKKGNLTAKNRFDLYECLFYNLTNENCDLKKYHQWTHYLLAIKGYRRFVRLNQQDIEFLDEFEKNLLTWLHSNLYSKKNQSIHNLFERTLKQINDWLLIE